MEYSELIHEFTDGTIEAVREPELFNVLASNEELRTEFKHQLALKSAIRTDAKAYTPAVHSTLQIFSSLGFVPPAPIAGAATGAGTVAVTAVKSAGFFSKFGIAMITGAVAVVTTGIIAYWLFNSEVGDLKIENKNLTSQLNIAKKQNEVPVVKSFAIDESRTENTQSEKVRIKYVYIKQTADSRQQTEGLNNGISEGQNDGMTDKKDNGEKITNIEQKTEDILRQAQDDGELIIDNGKSIFENALIGNQVYSLNFSNDILVLTPIIPQVQMDESSLFKVRENYGLSIELLNMENWFEIAPTISPKEYNKFNNTSVSLFYKIIEDFQAGIEYRRETFFQRFKGLDDKGKLNRYEQQPNFEGWGLVLRYANKDCNLWGIYPYLQLYGGGTNVGYILRGGTGLKYSPFDNLSLILGIGSSSLFYNHGGTPWQSNRYDLNYGISFGF